MGRTGQSSAGDTPPVVPSARAAAAAPQENEPGARCHWAISPYRPAVNSRAADERTHEQLEGLFSAGIQAGEWPAGTDPALAARLFTAGLYGLMAQWHLAPGSFSWGAAAAALAGGTAGGVSPADD